MKYPIAWFIGCVLFFVGMRMQGSPALTKSDWLLISLIASAGLVELIMWFKNRKDKRNGSKT